MRNIEFYFDFTSPYAYLSHCRLPALASEYGYSIVYRPVDLKRLKLSAGNTGPATVQMPVKLRYVMTDIMRWVRRYGADFNVGRGSSFDSESANRGAFYAGDRNQAGAYVTAIWQATYGAGGDMGSDELLTAVAEEMGWSGRDFLDFITSDESGIRYEESTAQAAERGIFGVPTVLVEDEMWWGNDRLDFLQEHLAAQQSD